MPETNKTAEQTNLLLEKFKGDHKAVIAFLLGHIDTVETELGFIEKCRERSVDPIINYKTLEDRLENK